MSDAAATSNGSTIVEAQMQIEELKCIITNNIEMFVNRSTNLEDLKQSCENLEKEAKVFDVQCRRVKRKMFFKNKKYCIVISLVLFILILFGVFSIYFLVIKK